MFQSRPAATFAFFTSLAFGAGFDGFLISSFFSSGFFASGFLASGFFTSGLDSCFLTGFYYVEVEVISVSPQRSGFLDSTFCSTILGLADSTTLGFAGSKVLGFADSTTLAEDLASSFKEERSLPP